MAKFTRKLTGLVKTLEHLLFLFPTLKQPLRHAVRVIGHVAERVQPIEDDSLARIAMAEHYVTQIYGPSVWISDCNVQYPLDFCTYRYLICNGKKQLYTLQEFYKRLNLLLTELQLLLSADFGPSVSIMICMAPTLGNDTFSNLGKFIFSAYL